MAAVDRICKRPHYPDFPILGVVPSLALSGGISLGITCVESMKASIWAFIAGFFMDLFTAAPAGGLALTYMIAIFAVTLINEVLPVNRFVIPMVLAALATTHSMVALCHLFLGLFGYNALLNFPTSLLSTRFAANFFDFAYLLAFISNTTNDLAQSRRNLNDLGSL